MTPVEGRWPIVEPRVAERVPGVAGGLIGFVQNVAQRMAPGIVGAEQQTTAVLLLQINLQGVVVVVAIRILISQRAQIRIGLEEVDRECAGNVESGRDAGGEFIGHQTAEIRRSGRQRLGQCARDALVQIRFDRRAREALSSGNRSLVSERSKSGLENGQRYLTGQATIRETTSRSP